MGEVVAVDGHSTCCQVNIDSGYAGDLEEAGYDPDLADYCYLSDGYTIFLEPRGSRRGQATSNLDLGLAKAVHIGKITLEFNLAVQNVFADEQPTVYNEHENFDPNALQVGEPTKWTQPRRYQIGVRVDF